MMIRIIIPTRYKSIGNAKNISTTSHRSAPHRSILTIYSYIPYNRDIVKKVIHNEKWGNKSKHSGSPRAI